MSFLKFFLIFAVLALPVNINASQFSEWSEEKPDKENLIIESEVRYKWYKEQIINEKYDFYDINTNYLIDLNDFIYTEYSEFSSAYPEEKLYREIEEETKLTSLEGKFNQIILKDFNTVDSIISEIMVTNKVDGQLLSWTLGEETIYQGYIERINDRDYFKDSITVNNDTYLVLNFSNEYDIDKFYISVHITDKKTGNETFKAIFKNNGNLISEKVITVNTKPKYCYNGKCKMSFERDDSWATYTELVEKLYRYRDKLFKYREIEKVYLDDYKTFIDSYIKDETQSKIFYRYKSMPVIKSVKKENTKINLNKEVNTNDIIKKNVIIIEPKTKSVSKQSNNYTKIIVISGIILSVILLLSKILYKKIKKTRTI